MSDSSSTPESNGFYSSEEQVSDHSIVQEMMQQIQEMAHQSKFAVLRQVIQLSTEHVEQRKQIAQLRRSLQKALQGRILAKRDLIVQHTFEANFKSLELQKRTNSLRLREKLETVYAHIKSNDTIRSQLKEDHMVARAEVDKTRKELANLDPKVAMLEKALRKGKAFLENTTHQLSSASQEKAKIQEDFRNKEYEIRSNASRKAEALQRMKMELAEKANSIKQCLGELQSEQQRLDEHSNCYEQWQSEVETLRQQYEQQKKNVDAELDNKKQHFEKQKELLHKYYVDQDAKNAEQVEGLTRMLEKVTQEDEAARQRVEELTTKLSNLENSFKNMNDSNAELEREIENYHRLNQKEMELARLKESVKTTKAEANDAYATTKPNVLSKGRATRYGCSKAASSTVKEKDNKPSADISNTSDSDALSFINSFIVE